MKISRSKVTVCTATFTELWLSGTPTRVISETLKISADKCDVTRKSLKLPRRESWHNSKAGKRTAYMPSPAEIRQKCLEFQAGWSDEERAKRLVGGGGASVRHFEVQVVPESIFRLAVSDDAAGYIENLASRETSG